jgi:hypothetical protein
MTRAREPKPRAGQVWITLDGDSLWEPVVLNFAKFDHVSWEHQDGTGSMVEREQWEQERSAGQWVLCRGLTGEMLPKDRKRRANS